MGIIDYYFQKKKKKFNLKVAPKPIISLPEQVFNKGFDALQDMLEYNIAPPIGNHSDIWTRPAPKFPGAYLWDSSFITQAWKLRDPEIGLRALKTFKEFQQKDGRMPHMVFWGGKKISALSNPPFLAWAVNDLLKYYPEDEWANYFIEPLINFIEWRKKTRLNKEVGLYFWEHSYESGIDNSPRFTSIDESEHYDVKGLGSIDLNAEIILQHQSLMGIIQNFAPEHQYLEKAKEELIRLSNLLEKTLWDSKKEVFGDIRFNSGELQTIDTIASYFPLMSNSLNSTIKQKMIDNLSNPDKYNTLVPAPSVAHDSETFVKDMWRGPVWMNTAYLVTQGLFKQGENKLASEYAYRLCKGVFETWKNEGSFYEFYDPDRYDLKELDRKKGNLYKKITLGAKPVKDFAGWTADVIPLLIEDIIGIKKEYDKWKLEPHIPKEWLITDNKIEIKLPYFDVKLSYTIKRDNSNFDYEIILKNKTYSGTIDNFKSLIIEQD